MPYQLYASAMTCSWRNGIKIFPTLLPIILIHYGTQPSIWVAYPCGKNFNQRLFFE
jgi:hypothetical protein